MNHDSYITDNQRIEIDKIGLTYEFYIDTNLRVASTVNEFLILLRFNYGFIVWVRPICDDKSLIIGWYYQGEWARGDNRLLTPFSFQNKGYPTGSFFESAKEAESNALDYGLSIISQFNLKQIPLC